MLSRHLPLVLLNENSKILGCHSLLCRPLNYIRGILFYILFYFSDFTGVISMCYYMRLVGSCQCRLNSALESCGTALVY